MVQYNYSNYNRSRVQYWEFVPNVYNAESLRPEVENAWLMPAPLSVGKTVGAFK